MYFWFRKGKHLCLVEKLPRIPTVQFCSDQMQDIIEGWKVNLRTKVSLGCASCFAWFLSSLLGWEIVTDHWKYCAYLWKYDTNQNNSQTTSKEILNFNFKNPNIYVLYRSTLLKIYIYIFMLNYLIFVHCTINSFQFLIYKQPLPKLFTEWSYIGKDIFLMKISSHFPFQIV